MHKAKPNTRHVKKKRNPMPLARQLPAHAQAPAQT